MDNYVRVHPALEEEAMADFKDGDGETWSHVIKDKHSGPMFFGDFEKFDFVTFALQIGGVCREFTWSQAEELGETIIALVKKHRGK